MKNIILFIALFFITLNSGFCQVFLISDKDPDNPSGSHPIFSTCGGTIYDSGGLGRDYGKNEDYTVTICSSLPGNFITLKFNEFNLEHGDFLSLYDGAHTYSTPIAINQSGASMTGVSYTSSGACMTLRFTSRPDGNTQAGFAASISCGVLCQDYSIAIEYATPELLHGPSIDSILICPNQPLTIEGTAVFPNNNQYYSQTVDDLKWRWILTSEHGLFDTVSNRYFDLARGIELPGVYYLDVIVLDGNSCSPVEQIRIKVYVSEPPTFDGTIAGPLELCVGKEVQLNGNVIPKTWEYTFPTIINDTVCFTDGLLHKDQVFTFTYSAFEPDRVITDLNNDRRDIEYVKVMFEHSYLGDLDIFLQCPNGQTATLLRWDYINNCQGQFFGIPIDNDQTPAICSPNYENIGVMWEYAWSPQATMTIREQCGQTTEGNSLMQGTYAAEDNSFQNLIGCPLNGQWKFIIVDHRIEDDGVIGSVEIQFGDDIVMGIGNFEHFTNVYDLTPTSTTSGWSGNGVISPNGASTTAIPAVSGMQAYTFTATDNFGCSYDTIVNVNVLPPGSPTCCISPTPNLGEDIEICVKNYTFNYIMPEHNTGEWSMVSGPGTATWSSQTAPNATVTVSQEGVYVFKWTEKFFGTETCIGEDEIKVSFWPVPTNDFTFTPIKCFGDETDIVYTGNMTATASFNWDFGDGQIVSGSGIGPYKVKWDKPGNNNISLSISENGCSSQESLTVINSPELLVSAVQLFDNTCFNACNGYAIASVKGGVLPYAYSWASGVERVENLCAGAYELIVNDANGCSATKNFVINEPAELLIESMQVSDIGCFGNAADGQISLHVVGGITPYEYIWSDGGPSSPTRVNLDAGNYFVTVKDANGCTVAQQITITQPEELVVDIFPEFEMCQGTSTTVSANAVGGIEPYTFYWDQGAGFVVATPSLVVDLDRTTDFNVYVLDANGCKSNTISSRLVVSPKMSIDNIKTRDSKCFQSCDGRTEISVNGGLPPFKYSWNSPSNVYENICAGSYSVTVTDKIGCEVTAQFVIDEPIKLTAESNVVHASCADSKDGEIKLYVQGGIPDYSYLWTDGSTDENLIAGAGEYSVTISDKNDCRITKYLGINAPLPIKVSQVSNESICKGQSVTLYVDVEGGTPDYTYIWTSEDGNIYNSNNVIVSPNHSTRYYLEVSDSKSCKGEPQEVGVLVYPELKILSVITGKNNICPGESTDIFVDIEGGNGGPYQVILLEDGSIVSSPFQVSPKKTTVYKIKVEDLCGTEPVYGSIKIDVKPIPEITFVSNESEGCVPLEVNFKEISVENRESYLWSFGDNNFATTKEVTHLYEKPGVFSVTLEVEDQTGCKNSKVIENMITVFPKPQALFEMSSESVNFLSPSVTFSNLSVGASNYKWYFGDGESSDHTSPVYFYRNIGDYEVMLVAESSNHCFDTIKSKVRVNNESTFYMPSSFTPNGDGVNDYIRPCGNGISTDDFTFTVYDRWGNIVFRTNVFNPEASCDSNSNGAWDGSLKWNNQSDKKLPNGVYFWHCDFKDWTGTVYSENGTLTLVR